MAKLPEKTSSTTVRQIRPPPLSQHLREFASRPDAWAVLARNMIPVIGMYGFRWSAALAVFNYWFDGLTAARTRARRSFRRSIAALGIRSRRSDLKKTPTLTPPAVHRFAAIHCGHCWPGFNFFWQRAIAIRLAS